MSKGNTTRGTLCEQGEHYVSTAIDVVVVVKCCLMSSDVSQGQVVTSAEARFNKSLRPRKPEGSLGRTAQDVHLDSHTAPELCCY